MHPMLALHRAGSSCTLGSRMWAQEPDGLGLHPSFVPCYCDLGQVTLPLCASCSTPVLRMIDRSTYLLRPF